ncbi:hypothetical protein LXA43DRAFT_1103097 [Ganoderma leucocontextum]|nr:hypothetical protein LXA43DRAFT_1103097 [Ganoderma leucocontextum]
MPGSFRDQDVDATGIAVPKVRNVNHNATVNVLGTGTLPNISAPSPGPSVFPTLDSQSGAILPISRISQSSIRRSTVSEGSSSVERTTKVRLVEIPTRQTPYPKLTQFQTFLQLQKPKMESRRVRAALEERGTAMERYEHDKAVWLQRAEAYERQLQDISASHAATQRELRATIEDRLCEISGLKQDLLEKNYMIEGIGLRCDELNTALAVVQDDMKREREQFQAEREQEIRNLEARLMSSIEQSNASLRNDADQVGSLPRPTSGAHQPDLPHEGMDLDTTPQSAPDQSASHVQSPTPRSASRATITTSHSAPQVPSHLRDNSNALSRDSTLSVLSRSAAEPNGNHARPSAPPPSSRPSAPPPSSRLSAPPPPLRTSAPPPPSRPRPPSSDDDNLQDTSTELPSLPPPSRHQRGQLRALQKVVDAEKERFKKSDDRNAHLNQVRRLFSDFFQAPEDEDFYSTHIAAPREAVDRYLDGKGPGPDTNDLHFTDLDPANNAWNHAVCSYLAKVLWNRQTTEGWVTKKGKAVAAVSEAYWEDAVLQKFKRVRSSWMNARRQLIQDPTTGRTRKESQQEVYTRRLDKLEETRTVVRQRMRRDQRWVRRKEICTTKMQLATKPLEKSHWAEILKIVEILGKDGMSSDESTEEEDTHRSCYRVSLLPWRREFDAIMEAIDVERFGEQSGYSKRGSVPTTRYRQDRRLAHSGDDVPSTATRIRISHRLPVPNLPAAFYDDGWISGRSEEYIDNVLHGSEQGYDWVIRVAEAYSGRTSSC